MSLDLDFAYERYGAGPPLIILHGLLGSGDNWRTLGRSVFSQHFDVYLVDQRNHGRSPHSEILDLPTMAADLRAFMDTQSLASAYLLGHSMGGKTAMQFALTHPTRVDALVIVDIAPKPYPPRHQPLLDALRALDLRRYRTRAGIDEALRPEIPDASIRNFLLKNLQRRSEGGYTWKINLEGIYQNYHRLNENLEADGLFEGATLFVRGGASDYIADEDTEVIRSFFPNAEFLTLDGAGHWIHAEQPEAFADAILAFLRP